MKYQAILLFLFVATLSFGQQKQKIIDKAIDDCGCKYEGSPNVGNMQTKLQATFIGNEKVSYLLNNIGTASTKNLTAKNIETWIADAMKKEKDNEAWPALKDSLIRNYVAIVKEMDPNNLAATQATMLCEISRALHHYYLEFGGAGDRQTAYYETLFAEASTEKADSNSTEAPAPTTPTEEAGSGFPFSWLLAIVAILAAGGLFFLWNSSQTKLKKQAQSTAQAQMDLNNAKKMQDEQNKKLQAENAQLTQKIAALEKELEEKKRYIQELEWQKAKASENQFKEPVVPLITSKITRYLFAPTADGVFYQNNIKDQKNSDTFYSIELTSDSDETGTLSLLTDPEILHRAESAPQDYLFPACDLQSKGKINSGTLQIIPGTVRREGGGWRIVKKVTLRW